MRYFLLATLVATISVGHAQVLDKNGNLTAKEEAQNKVYYKTLTVIGIPADTTLRVTITNLDLNATFNSDYSFLPDNGIGVKELTSKKNIITIGIIVKADTYPDDDEKFILTYAYNNLDNSSSPQLIRDTVTIKDLNFQEGPDTSKYTVRIVTGSNFDFFDAPTFKNYAGDLNIFLPNIIKPILGKRLGLNIGAFNYRYYDADSSGNAVVTENYLLDPNVQRIAADTTKYIRDIYRLNSKTTYNNIGLYLNPMIELSSDKGYGLYLELHAEVIWRTQILSHSQQPIRKDTFIITQTDILNKGVFQDFKGITSLYQKTTYFDKYFGFGLPFKAKIRNSFELFLSPSVGISSFHETLVTTSDRLSIRSRTFTEGNSWEPYFLGKFQLTTTVAPVDITLGGEFREVFGKNTFLGMYLGAAISLDKLVR